MRCDFLIVGCGLTGAVFAERIASILKKEVLIIDKRDHIAGNTYDFYNEHDIFVHKYGPHIFHTNSDKVWKYLSLFTDWRDYEHKVLASIASELVPIPFNFNSIKQCFTLAKAEHLIHTLTENFGKDKKIPILKLKANKNPVIAELAEFVYYNVFLNYNLKQWGKRPEEVDDSVTARVPVYTGYDDRYFHDIYQGIPKAGYTQMVANMLDHANIKYELCTDYDDVKNTIEYKKLIFTGPIDAFFEYEYGPLEYRSLNFSFVTHNQTDFQPVAQVNYPNTQDYTRITEFKHLTGQIHPHTTVAYEYPMGYSVDKNEPYYPVPEAKNKAVYEKYQKLTQNFENVIFAGRLAEYRYYNMDQVIARALHLFESMTK